MRVGSHVRPISLVGEEIEGEWNAAALTDIAEVFGGLYIAYGEKEASVAATTAESFRTANEPMRSAIMAWTPRVTSEHEYDRNLSNFDYLIAAENAPGAQSVYSFRPPPTASAAIVVGNEVRGLRARTLKRAGALVEIPLRSRNINCLNVAAAAAVMLYYLSQNQRLGEKQTTSAAMSRQRPDVLLLGGVDHRELGSTIRSACAFGWDHVFLDDRHNAWYECDRRIKSEGRGTARRGRNPIKVIPHRADRLADYRTMVVYTTKPVGRAAWQVPVTSGATLAVLPDESHSAKPWSPPADWDGEIIYATLPEASAKRYHYRQMSAIALAEVARQVGKSTSNGVYLHRKQDRYRRETTAVPSIASLTLQDLQLF